jgi:hypothetical protein
MIQIMRHSNLLQIRFKAIECNGWPKIQVKLNGCPLHCHEFTDSSYTLAFDLPVETQTNVLTIERYGKTFENQTADSDQILEIVEFRFDDVVIPTHLIVPCCKFEYNDQTDWGSLYFGPNGIWTLNFSTPFVTWLLDQNILHEAKYSENYKYPWSYQLGPNSVNEIIADIEQIEQKVIDVL